MVCRQLGYGTGTKEVQAVALMATADHAQSLIWLDNVQCNGSETSLLDCAHDGLAKHSCAEGGLLAAVSCNEQG